MVCEYFREKKTNIVIIDYRIDKIFVFQKRAWVYTVEKHS